MSGWTEQDLKAYYDRLKESPEASKALSNVGCGDTAITLEFFGKVPSKKNRYSPRKDRPGFYKNRKLQGEIDALALQIPGQYRDLKLESPAMDFFFTYVRANWDRDNAAQCLTDILVEYGVLRDDNIRRNNSRITIHPAIEGDCDGVRVVLTPKP